MAGTAPAAQHPLDGRPGTPARRRSDAIAVETVRTGRHHPGLHSDALPMLLYVESGSGWYRQGDESTKVGPGSLFFLVPGEAHDVDGLRTTLTWMVRFRPEVVGVVLDGGQARRPAPGSPVWLRLLRPASLHGGVTVSAPARARWQWHLRALAHELRTRPAGYGQAAPAHLTLLLVALTRLTFPALDGASLRREPLIAGLFAVIDERYREPLSLQDIAQEVALSPRHLTRVTRRLTGRTVMEWVLERRMAEARRLLLESALPVEQISRLVGYRDPGHFRRQFRRKHGVAPSQWRANVPA
jgi:AraC family transcriptional activator of pobA